MSLFLLIISSLSLFLNLVEEEARPLCRHPRACPIGPAGEEGGPGGIQNLLKEEWKVQDGTEKKEDDDDQEEMEGKRRNEEKMQRSLVVVKFPLVPFATCLLPLQLLLKGFFFTNKKLNNHIVVIHKKPNRCTRSPGTPVCQSSATTVIRTYQESPACLNTCWWSMVVCLQGCGNKFNPNNSINRHKKLLCGKPHHRKSFSCFSMWGNYHH